MEFKERFYAGSGTTDVSILIESQWNLKEDGIYMKAQRFSILIESQWNLKYDKSHFRFHPF